MKVKKYETRLSPRLGRGKSKIPDENRAKSSTILLNAHARWPSADLLRTPYYTRARHGFAEQRSSRYLADVIDITTRWSASLGNNLRIGEYGRLADDDTLQYYYV